MIDPTVEIRRIADLMHCKEHDLDYLLAVSPEGLMQLRMQFQDSLIDDFEPALSKLAATASISPAALSEKICVRYLGPTLTSYLSYYTPIKTAAKLAHRFDTDFLIAVASEQIPERAKTMLADFPVDLMRPITRGLVEKRDWPTMGGFVDHLPADKSLALIEEIPDSEASLRISSFAQNKELIATVVTKFDDEMLISLVKASLTDIDLIREVCVVVQHLPAESVEKMKRLRDNFSDEEQKRLYDYATEHGFDALASLYN